MSNDNFNTAIIDGEVVTDIATESAQAASVIATFRDDVEEAVFQARRVMKEGAEAARHYAKMGLIRPKTKAEIEADLAALKGQQVAKAHNRKRSPNVFKDPEAKRACCRGIAESVKQGNSWEVATNGTPYEGKVPSARLACKELGLHDTKASKERQKAQRERLNRIARLVNQRAQELGNLAKALAEFEGQITDHQYNNARHRLCLPAIGHGRKTGQIAL